jgi:hypothetical protein
LHGETTLLNGVVARAAKRNQVAEFVGAPPVTSEQVGRREMMDVQVAAPLRLRVAMPAGLPVSAERGSSLRFPVLAIVPTPTPSAAKRRIVGADDVSLPARGAAIEVLIQPQLGWPDQQPLAAARAGNLCLGMARCAWRSLEAVEGAKRSRSDPASGLLLELPAARSAGVHPTFCSRPAAVRAVARLSPPFPSCDNYDAKAWRFIRAQASPGALFWNVAA